ncbi:DnaJ domain-containing protein [Qipengyuania soli]|uniref:DnaJ domain-containing protein n=1 Tax=Qipengyuania soli TaxID=2782568 RepID=A0A7S8ISY5_9SPHN|nr:DnaJ domain-containing protein [Qipengyuania soli]QPC99378.1 DnaJ domain-containing protein [Qipengyuania soli]
MNDESHSFTDFYALLQVSPTCDAKMLEKAYRYFAQMYHPDHTQTADVDKFQEIIEAYRVLRDPDSRAEYDREYRTHHKDAVFEEVEEGDLRIDERTASEDASAHEKILQFLYKRRREKPRDPGVIGFYIQELIDCSDDTFDFHAWYLKSKGLIRATEHGTFEITIEGVDHVIAMSREAERGRFISDQSWDDRTMTPGEPAPDQ